MTRFTCFTNKELDTMEYAFNIARDNTSFDTLQKRVNKFIDEIRAERVLRGKEEVRSDTKHEKAHEFFISRFKKPGQESNIDITCKVIEVFLGRKLNLDELLMIMILDGINECRCDKCDHNKEDET